MMKALIFNPNKKILILLSALAVFSLLVFYIFQINNLVSGKYLLAAQQKSFKNLSQENEKLEANLANLGSLSDIEGKVSELGFERIGQIHYVQILEGAVARAK
jgi:hypothetical protein